MIKEASLYDLFILTPKIVSDYYSDVNGFDELKQFMLKLYSGVYRLLIIDESAYAIVYFSFNNAFLIYLSKFKNDNNISLKLINSLDEIKKEYKVENIILKNYNVKNNALYAKICKESYTTFII